MSSGVFVSTKCGSELPYNYTSGTNTTLLDNYCSDVYYFSTKPTDYSVYTYNNGNFLDDRRFGLYGSWPGAAVNVGHNDQVVGALYINADDAAADSLFPLQNRGTDNVPDVPWYVPGLDWISNFWAVPGGGALNEDPGIILPRFRWAKGGPSTNQIITSGVELGQKDVLNFYNGSSRAYHMYNATNDFRKRMWGTPNPDNDYAVPGTMAAGIRNGVRDSSLTEVVSPLSIGYTLRYIAEGYNGDSNGSSMTIEGNNALMQAGGMPIVNAGIETIQFDSSNGAIDGYSMDVDRSYSWDPIYEYWFEVSTGGPFSQQMQVTPDDFKPAGNLASCLEPGPQGLIDRPQCDAYLTWFYNRKDFNWNDSSNLQMARLNWYRSRKNIGREGTIDGREEVNDNAFYHIGFGLNQGYGCSPGDPIYDPAPEDGTLWKNYYHCNLAHVPVSIEGKQVLYKPATSYFIPSTFEWFAYTADSSETGGCFSDIYDGYGSQVWFGSGCARMQPAPFQGGPKVNYCNEFQGAPIDAGNAIQESFFGGTIYPLVANSPVVSIKGLNKSEAWIAYVNWCNDPNNALQYDSQFTFCMQEVWLEWLGYGWHPNNDVETIDRTFWSALTQIGLPPSHITVAATAMIPVAYIVPEPYAFFACLCTFSGIVAYYVNQVDPLGHTFWARMDNALNLLQECMNSVVQEFDDAVTVLHKWAMYALIALVGVGLSTYAPMKLYKWFGPAVEVSSGVLSLFGFGATIMAELIYAWINGDLSNGVSGIWKWYTTMLCQSLNLGPICGK